MTTLFHLKGYAASDTKAAAERARLLIEQAEALGEPPEDPLLLFSVLYGIWAANLVAFNGVLARAGAEQFLALAEKQAATVPLMLGHRIMATTSFYLGEFAESRKHYDRAIALYDPGKHRPVAIRFGQDVGVSSLSYRAWALWVLGYPAMAIADTERALSDAREIGQPIFKAIEENTPPTEPARSRRAGRAHDPDMHRDPGGAHGRGVS